jgi:hypothetical protein
MQFSPVAENAGKELTHRQESTNRQGDQKRDQIREKCDWRIVVREIHHNNACPNDDGRIDARYKAHYTDSPESPSWVAVAFGVGIVDPIE